MSHEYDAIIVVKETGPMTMEGPAMQIKVNFCTCGNQLRSCKRIHSVMDMYHFVTYSVQSVINSYEKCGLRDLLIVLATSIPKATIQYHMWCETEPSIPADARYNMYVEVHSDDPSLYPDITMADFDKQSDIMDMLRGTGLRVYTLGEEGGPQRIV